MYARANICAMPLREEERLRRVQERQEEIEDAWTACALISSKLSSAARERVGKLIASALSRRAVVDTERVRVPRNEIWTVAEVALHLKVSEDKIRIDVRKGLIPGAFQLGDLWRFRVEDVRGIGRKTAD